jgi:hypothetical protein
MRQASNNPKAKRDIKTRQHLMERTFARGKRLGIKRARWRGLWRMKIQEYLTCAVQNIQILISRDQRQRNAAVNAARDKKYSCIHGPKCGFLSTITPVKIILSDYFLERPRCV